MNYWIGWWMCDIMEFVDLLFYKYSKWYIILKLEWFLLVVIFWLDVV